MGTIDHKFQKYKSVESADQLGTSWILDQYPTCTEYSWLSLITMREIGLKDIGPWMGMGYSKYMGGKWVIGQFD